MKLFGIVFTAASAADICYDDVGCFTDDPPFSMFGYRPRRLPKSPENSLNKILLTNKFHQKPIPISWNAVETRFFDLTKPVVVMTHGWNDEWSGDHWLTEAQSLFLNYEDVNYVGVEWAKAGQNIDYFQSAADTQTVGRIIAKMLSQLPMASSSFHCVGHSLGAHVCSYAGKYLQSEFSSTLGRITGMDPAGPAFQKTTKAVRLDASDASFVDVIHTNGGEEDEGFLGMSFSIGHADFYPNGGVSQPGCWDINFICSHGEAPWMFVDSIKGNNCEFNTCEEGSDVSCRLNKNSMGWKATKPTIKHDYFGTTGKQAPYC